LLLTTGRLALIAPQRC